MEDPFANFRDPFSGSSHSGNDVCQSFLKSDNHSTRSSMLLRLSKSLMLTTDGPTLTMLWTMSKTPYVPLRSPDHLDSALAPFFISSLMLRTLRAALQIYFHQPSQQCWWQWTRAATKEEIQSSGVTVASLFFRNVFGVQAQRALSVFVALRLTLFPCISVWFMVILCSQCSRVSSISRNFPTLTFSFSVSILRVCCHSSTERCITYYTDWNNSRT